MIPLTDKWTEIEQAARHIAEGKFYVEARIGSNNYRNRGEYSDKCRLLRDGATCNDSVDVVLKQLANGFLSLIAQARRGRMVEEALQDAKSVLPMLKCFCGIGPNGFVCSRCKAIESVRTALKETTDAN